MTSELYWNNYCKATTNCGSWIRMRQEFGSKYDAIVAKAESKAFLELLHYHWSLDNFQ
jgi:hypothetical protein